MHTFDAVRISFEVGRKMTSIPQNGLSFPITHHCIFSEVSLENSLRFLTLKRLMVTLEKKKSCSKFAINCNLCMFYYSSEFAYEGKFLQHYHQLKMHKQCNAVLKEL